jgi:hypothetical protein
MGWRFRRSVSIAGVRLNFGKQGFTSWSVGGGLFGRVTVGKRGVTRTLSIPGTGLSHVERIGRPSRAAAAVTPAPEPAAPPAPDAANRMRFLWFGLAGAALLLTGAFGAWMLLLAVAGVVVGLTVPSRARLQARLEEAEPPLNVTPNRSTSQHTAARADPPPSGLSETERDRRCAQVLAAIATALDKDDVTEEALRSVLALPAALGLAEDEGRAEVAAGYDAEIYGDDEAHAVRARMRTRLDVVVFLAEVVTNGGAPIPVPGPERVIGTSPCWFMRADVLWDKHPFSSESHADPVGNLYLTTTEAVFHEPGGVVARVAWPKVMEVTFDDRTLSIQRRDRQTPTVFMFKTAADAYIAGWVAHRLWKNGPGVAPKAQPRKVQSRSARETVLH